MTVLFISSFIVLISSDWFKEGTRDLDEWEVGDYWVWAGNEYTNGSQPSFIRNESIQRCEVIDVDRYNVTIWIQTWSYDQRDPETNATTTEYDSQNITMSLRGPMLDLYEYMVGNCTYLGMEQVSTPMGDMEAQHFQELMGLPEDLHIILDAWFFNGVLIKQSTQIVSEGQYFGNLLVYTMEETNLPQLFH